MRWLRGLFFGFVLCVAYPLHATDFPFAQAYFERVGDRDAIPSGVVTAMVRAPNGIWWIGTQTGLLKYDGYRFKQYQFEPSSPNSMVGNFVTALTAGADGLIYIGTNDGLSVLNPAADHFSNHQHQPSRPDALGDNNITDIALASDRVYVATATGLQVMDLASGRFAPLMAASAAIRPNQQRVRSLLVDRQRVLWVGTWDGLLRQTENGQLESVGSDPAVRGSLAGQAVNAIFEAADGAMMIGTRQNGMVRMSRQGAILASFERPDRDASSAGQRVQSILQLRGGELWVATTLGIYVLEPLSLAIQSHLRHNKDVFGGLAFDAIGSLAQDDAGMIWVGTWGGGLQKTLADGAAFRTLRLDADGTGGLSHSDVHSVLELSDGHFWVGTGGNGIDVIDRSRGRVGGFRPAENDPAALSDGVVVAMKQAADGSVWVGTQLGGLFKADPVAGKFRRIGPAGSVSDVLVARDGVVWVGGTAGVSRILLGTERLEPVLDQDQQAVLGSILPMTQDPEGRIWVGSADGLRVLLPGEARFRSIRHDPARVDSLVHDSIYGLLVDRDGALWVATGQGIDRMLPGPIESARFSHVSAELGAPGRDLGANLLQDDAGRIWSDSAVIDPAARTIYTLTRADGVDLGTSWFGAYTRSRDGLFLSGGTEGLLLIRPSAFKPWRYAPEVVATELRINGERAPLSALSNGLVLKPAQRSFSIEVASLDYSAPQNNQHSWQLEGFDSGFVDAGYGQRQASYSNLWPGSYRLVVRGSNRVGSFSDKRLEIPIVVLPAFWQTRWFIAALALAALLLVALALRWRTHQLQRRGEQLDLQVRARTAELETANRQLLASNAALEQARSHLLETQAKLVFQEKMASMGQLVAGVAHEVNTPLGVAITASSFLRDRTIVLSADLAAGTLQKTVLSGYVSDAKAASEMVCDNLARAARLVTQFKQVSAAPSFAGSEQIDLDALLRALLPGLRQAIADSALKLEYLGAPALLLTTDADAVNTVLMQLLDNARTHAYSPHQAGSLQLWATAQERVVEISLRDDGCGMDEQTSAQAFEPFFTTRRNRGGVGLGLHIAFNLVTARLGGTLALRSAPGEGSTFTLRIPAPRLA